MRRRRILAYLALLPAAPFLPYVFWRYWQGAEPAAFVLWMLPLLLLGATFGLLWLLRRDGMRGVAIPIAFIVSTIGLCGLAAWHGRYKALHTCSDALRLPVGEYAGLLSQLAAYDGVGCAVSDHQGRTWHLLVQAAGRNVGYMWLVLDEHGELVLRRASAERIDTEGRDRLGG